MEKIILSIITQYKGTIKFMSFEGGFYGIVTDNNLKFLPTNLTEKYRQNGAIVEFSGDEIKDIITFQQWGIPFEINEISLIKPGCKGDSSFM